MYNVTKTIAVAAMAFIAAACGSDGRTDSAARLLESAREAYSKKQYPAALTLIDSLDRGYRDCLDQRREGTRLRIETLRDMALDSIGANDARLSELQQSVDRMQPDFRHIDVPGTAGYLVYAPAKDSWNLGRTDLQPRVDPDGYFFIAVNIAGRTIGLSAISLDGTQARGTAATVEGSEIMNVGQEAATTLMEALMNRQAPVRLSLDGSRGKTAVTLDATALDAFKATWRYALGRQELRRNLIRREMLERQLSRLRDQLANLPIAEETEAAN